MTAEAEAIVAHRVTGRDGSSWVEVDVWPERTTFTSDLAIFDPELVRRVGDLITVRAANGNATYRIDAEHADRLILECVLEDSELEPRGPF